MKIKNTLQTLPTYALPRLLYWLCEELSLPFAGVHTVEFNKTDKVWSGRVVFKERKIVNSINPSAKFPLKLTNKSNDQKEIINNELELLVLATAANLAYLREYWEMSFIRAVQQPHVPQNNVDKRAFEILRKFRDCQTELISRWNAEPPKDIPVETVQSEDHYKQQIKTNTEELTKLRGELNAVKGKANALRKKIHQLHVRNGYCNRAIKQKKTKGTEWTVPQRFFLTDIVSPKAPRHQPQEGQTIIVE